MGLVRSLSTFWRPPPRLTIELVPRSCWYKNVRALVSPEQWHALCDFCHEVTHMGLTRTNGRHGAALAHLARVNGWSRRTAADYARQCFDEWDRRSRRRWRQDLALLDDWLPSDLRGQVPESRRGTRGAHGA
jgi:hypothetical protein